MTLTLPVVSTTIGPLWAEELNTALELVDLHDHTSGKGVKVPTAGLNINADLSFAGNAALSLKHVGITSGITDPAIAGAVYVKNGDLYFTSPTLTAVQLTDGTSIKGVTGNISGLGDGGSSAAFNDFTEDFTFRFGSSNRFAAFNIGEVRLYPFDGVNGYANPITVKAPLSLAAAYQITLPGSLPLADNVLSVTSAGVVQQGLGDGSAAAPSIAFASDPDTGMYRFATNTIGLAVNGLCKLELSSARTLVNTPLLQIDANGTATVPTFAPGSNAATGISASGNTMYAIANSTTLMTLNTTSVKAEIPLYAAVGLTVQAGGAAITGNSSVTGKFTATNGLDVDAAGIYSKSTSAAVRADGGFSSDGGVRWKIKTTSGAIGAGATTTVYTGSVPLGGYFGIWSNSPLSSTANKSPISGIDGTTGVCFAASLNTGNITLTNLDAGTRYYTITLIERPDGY